MITLLDAIRQFAVTLKRIIINTFCLRLLAEILLKIKWTLSWTVSFGCVISPSVAPSNVSIFVVIAREGGCIRERKTKIIMVDIIDYGHEYKEIQNQKHFFKNQ